MWSFRCPCESLDTRLMKAVSTPTAALAVPKVSTVVPCGACGVPPDLLEPAVVQPAAISALTAATAVKAARHAGPRRRVSDGLYPLFISGPPRRNSGPDCDCGPARRCAASALTLFPRGDIPAIVSPWRDCCRW